jgi:hypothetical protein
MYSKQLKGNKNIISGIPRGGWGCSNSLPPQIPKLWQSWAEIVLKYQKLRKFYYTKFLVPNYCCLQNPWLGGYRPQIPVLSVLNSICWTPPPQIPGYATEHNAGYVWHYLSPNSCEHWFTSHPHDCSVFPPHLEAAVVKHKICEQPAPYIKLSKPSWCSTLKAYWDLHTSSSQKWWNISDWSLLYASQCLFCFTVQNVY